MSLPELDTSRVYDAPDSRYSGPAWRHVGPRYDARSGDGARIAGGRFNPPNSFPVLYLCLSRPCAAAELRRLASRQVVGLDGLLPRKLIQFDVELDSILDLTDAGVRAHVGVSLVDLVDEDRTSCRSIGIAAHARGMQGVLSVSATGVDVVLALLPENLGSGKLAVVGETTWLTENDLDPAP